MIKLKTILQCNWLYIILLVFTISYVTIQTTIREYESKLKDETELSGIVIDMNIKTDKISFVLKSREKIACNYYVEDTLKYQNLLGKHIKVTGVLKEPKNNAIPNTFNYKKYLYNNKIYKNFTVDTLEITKEENIFYKIKNKISSKINENDEIIKTYLNLFILGDNAYLDNEMYDVYRNNGIWHLFAISGTYISLIILILSNILKRLKIKNLIIYGTLSYFMFLTNFSSSVMRSTIFYFIKELTKLFNIKLSNLKILLLTAFVILLINPFIIYNAGFQYSFLISFTLIIFSEKIKGNYFSKTFQISVISFLVSLPITINMNYEINFLSIFLNLIYVPFISFIVFPISIISFFIPFISHILTYCIYILEFSNKFFNNFNIIMIIPKLNLVFILFYYLWLYLFFVFDKKIYFIFFSTTILFGKISMKIDNYYHIQYLDVGQGDSSIIISPHKKEIILIDTGGILFSNYHLSNETITYMKSLGISSINAIIITHGDFDHMGEAINLVNNFKVEKVIFNCGEFNELEQALIKVLDKKKIKYYSCIKELNIDNNKLYFLQTKEYNNENDNSNVIYTEIDGYKFMFMGDAGVNTEKEILNRYNLTDIDILKVGHHGSKTSSGKEFINEINPKYSIISVGKNNRYGHPNKEVLENLENSNIYRTDLDGSIMFKINNNKLKIET